MIVEPTVKGSIVARARAWVARPLGRGLLVLSGLVVLSLVGRFAVAGGQVPPVASIAASAIPVPMMPLAPVLSDIDASSPSAPPPVHHSPHASEDDPVVLNEATVDDLRRLPGVGEKRAVAILELRKKLGHFRQVEELLRVKGIGRATLRRIRPLVKLDHAVVEAGTP